MVIITFRDGSDWFYANWVFRQLAEDTMAAFPSDCVLRSIMEPAPAYGALFLDELETEAAASTLKAIRKVAEDTIEGRIHGWKQTRPEDEDGQKMYRACIVERLELIRKQENSPTK